jgi:hypothetical protein
VVWTSDISNKKAITRPLWSTARTGEAVAELFIVAQVQPLQKGVGISYRPVFAKCTGLGMKYGLD